MPVVMSPADAEADAKENDGKHRVMLALELDDYDKLRFLVSLDKSNNNEALRKCIRYAWQAEMVDIRKRGGAA